jgi:hypothetical protein
MPRDRKDWLLVILAAAVLALFSGVWLWIGFKMLCFDASPSTPILTFTEAQVTVAGFLASAVGAGTASVLGIEIQKRSSAENTIAGQVTKAAASSWLLVAGIGLYALIGGFVLVVWFFKSDIAPDMVSAFSLGVLGWLAGAFAAVFRADTPGP